MDGTGVSPQRTADPEEALRLRHADGAAILVTKRTDPQGTLEGARAVFAQHLSAHQGLSRVSSNRTPGEDTYFDPVTRTVHANAGVVLGLHVDGYMAFGARYPDLVFLLCERPAPRGGESFVVDGTRLVQAIEGDPDHESLAQFLWQVALEQSRPDNASPVGTSAPVPHRRPIASRTPAGRLTVIFHEHQRPRSRSWRHPGESPARPAPLPRHPRPPPAAVGRGCPSGRDPGGVRRFAFTRLLVLRADHPSDH